MKVSLDHGGTNEFLVSTSGSVVAGSILALLLLTALAGWPWVEKFLESGAPAWIQAVGSVMAIFVALAIVQRQHSLEIQRRDEEGQTVQTGRARALRVIFFAAASACEEVATSVSKSSGPWDFRAQTLREVRSRLLAIDPLQVPDQNLLLVVENCSMKLRTASILVAELEQPRDKLIHEAVEDVVKVAALECWLGFKESTKLELKLTKLNSFTNDISPDFDALRASRNELAELRKKALYRGDIPLS